jgi:hypothetical protein
VAKVTVVHPNLFIGVLGVLTHVPAGQIVEMAEDQIERLGDKVKEIIEGGILEITGVESIVPPPPPGGDVPPPPPGGDVPPPPPGGGNNLNKSDPTK